MMGIKKGFYFILDNIYYLLCGMPKEDEGLLQFYRLSYVFANGVDYGIPDVSFSGGGYWISGLILDRNNYRLDHKYNPRVLKRMAKRLIKRRFSVDVSVPLNKDTYKFIYNTLTQKEKNVLDGKCIAQKQDKSEHIDWSLLKACRNERLVSNPEIGLAKKEINSEQA